MDLKFFGYDISDARSYEQVQAIIRQEMKERQPDASAPGGYAPNDRFKQQASQFGKDYREFRDDILERIKTGNKIPLDEYITLVRGEKINVSANSTSMMAGKRLSLLDAGKNPFGFNGMSDSRLIGKLTGYDKEDRPREALSIKIDHGFGG